MHAQDGLKAARLLDACEAVLRDVDSVEQVTVRRIASAAGSNPSAVNYHFGSQEELIIAAARRVYQRLNAERLSLLTQAVDRHAPEPAEVEELIEALIGPPVRWSLDPRSAYRVLAHMTTLAQKSREPERYRALVEGIEHHAAFIPHFRRIAPWLDEVDIGWRLNCALGIRSQVLRQRARSEALTAHGIDFSDPETVIARMVEVVAPMFRRPLG